MQKNENRILFDSPKGKMKKVLLLESQMNTSISDKKYFIKKSVEKGNNLNTKIILRKDSQESNKQRQNAKSGFILGRKEILSNLKSPELERKISVRSVFKRRVNSESKVPAVKSSFDYVQENKHTQSKTNFSKKLIQELKNATLKLNKSAYRYDRYAKSNDSSKRQMNLNNESATNISLRQKLKQKSIEKLRPSFNINEVKFYSSKKSLRKLSREGEDSSRKSRLHSRVQRHKKQKQVETQHNENLKAFQMVKKRCSQPLVSYNDYIGGSSNVTYTINVDYLLQYAKQPVMKSVLGQIDFGTLKLISSIHLCLIEMLDKLQAGLKVGRSKDQQYEEKSVIKEYIEVYFHSYARIKIQYIVCEVIYKQARQRLFVYLILQRIMFYFIYVFIDGKLVDHLHELVEFLKLSEEIHRVVMNMLHEEAGLSAREDRVQKGVGDMFRGLRIVREVDKRLGRMRSVVDALINNKKTDHTPTDKQKQSHLLLSSFLGLLQVVNSSPSQSILSLYLLQQYLNWTKLSIPPLFYLPPGGSKQYTLVIDLDGTLIHYNQDTKILKYRPYMDRFLAQMKKHFQLIVFSSYSKDRTDLIVQEIQRDDRMFQYRLYKSHMVFQEGMVRKNVGYLGRSMQKVVFVDDEDKNADWLPLNSYKIKSFEGDKKDKQLLHLGDWLSALIQTEPGDIRGRLKKNETGLDDVQQVDENSSTIQASI